MNRHNNSTPTANIEVPLAYERGVVAAAILDPTGRQAKILCQHVHSAEWVSSLHRAVFQAINALVERDQLPLEYNSVIAEMMRQGTFQSYTNGYSFVSSLGEGIVLALPMTKRILRLREEWRQYREARDAER